MLELLAVLAVIYGLKEIAQDGLSVAGAGRYLPDWRSRWPSWSASGACPIQ